MKKLLTLALLATTAAFSAGAQTAPANTTITNQARLDFLNPDGSAADPITSNIVSATVQAVYAVDITPNGSIEACEQTFTGSAGTAVDIPYTISNTGNTTDNYALGALVQNDPATDVQFFQRIGTSLIPLSDNQLANITFGSSIDLVMRYTIPTNTAPGSTINVTPVAVSQSDSTVRDSNNYACVGVTANYGLTLTPANDIRNVPAGSSPVFTDTLTNIGNINLSTNEITLSATNSTGLTTRYQVTASGTDADPTGTWYASPQEALNAYLGTGVLTPGSSLNIHEETQVPVTSTSDGTDTPESSTTVTALINVAPSALITNTSSDPISAVDAINIVTAQPAIVKTQLNCGTDGACAVETDTQATDSAYQGSISVRPCEIIRYVIRVSNTGQAPLIAPVIRDLIPNDLTNVNYYASLPATYTVGSSTSTSPVPVASGNTLTVGLDSNNDGATNVSDTLAAGANFDLIIQGQVACGQNY